MVDVGNLDLVAEVQMVDTSEECLERLKDALNGGYAVFSSGSRVMVFEVEE